MENQGKNSDGSQAIRISNELTLNTAKILSNGEMRTGDRNAPDLEKVAAVGKGEHLTTSPPASIIDSILGDPLKGTPSHFTCASYYLDTDRGPPTHRTSH